MKSERLVFSALMLALSTVLSFVKVFQMPLGGAVTLASMLPLVIVALRYNVLWSLATAFCHGTIQLILGLSNVAYAQNWYTAVAIVMLDYLLAFTSIGLSGIFKNKFKIIPAAVCGMSVAYFLRFVCHFTVGWFVWDALWPNEQGLLSPIYSLVYNGPVILAELVISLVAIIAILKITALRKILVNIK